MFGLNRPPPTRTLVPTWTVAVGEHVIALAVAPDGRSLAVGTTDGTLCVLAHTGAVLHQWTAHRFGLMALAFRRQGTWLATAGQDGTARVWERATAQLVTEFAGGARWVERVAWNPAGTQVAWSAGRRVGVATAQGPVVFMSAELPSTVADLTWCPSGELTAAAYGGLWIWPTALTTPHHLEWKGSCLTAAWSPDGKVIAAGNQDATIHFWRYPNGTNAQMWGYPAKVRELAWDRRSRYLATGGAPTVVVWDFRAGPEETTPLRLEAHDDVLTQLAFQPVGEWLASGGRDGQVGVWDLRWPQRPTQRLRLPGAEITQLAWTPNGAALVVGTNTGQVSWLPID
jgi:WD40 repeat protein